MSVNGHARKQTAVQEATEWVWSLTNVNGTAKLLLLCLARDVTSRTGNGWVADPSLSRIAREAGIGRSTAVRLLNDLVEDKVIQRAPGSPKGDTTTYTLLAASSRIGTSPKTRLVPNRNQSRRAPSPVSGHKSKEYSPSLTGNSNPVDSSFSSSSPAPSPSSPIRQDDDEHPEIPATPPETPDAYAKIVLGLYVALPSTRRKKPTRSDRQLCFDWYTRRLPVNVVELAFWYAESRRLEKPHEPVNSLKYFEPVVAEVVSSVKSLPDVDRYVRQAREHVLTHRAERTMAAVARAP
jgi:hypothetical protein